MKCPLCYNNNLVEFKEFQDKNYFECSNCKLIFLHPEHRLNEKEESARYAYHQNSINDEGYVKFLNQIIEPALKYINKYMSGLDFGCGHNPVLAQLLNNMNINCAFYDPYFFPEINNNCKYDFIFATECFEHFFNPGKEIETISSKLNKNGILAIMTEFYLQKEEFMEWYYIKDPTHVCFYNLKTFDFVCKEYKFRKLFLDNKRVVILEKQ